MHNKPRNFLDFVAQRDMAVRCFMTKTLEEVMLALKEGCEETKRFMLRLKNLREEFEGKK